MAGSIHYLSLGVETTASGDDCGVWSTSIIHSNKPPLDQGAAS